MESWSCKWSFKVPLLASVDSRESSSPSKRWPDFTVVQSVRGSADCEALGGGASQFVLSTKSGTNAFHGSVYWYNRNNALAANDWFNNQSGTPKAFLNKTSSSTRLRGSTATTLTSNSTGTGPTSTWSGPSTVE